MLKNIAVAMIVLASTFAANAETPAWSDVLKTCSAEYKERADKTKGREVWQAFLTECKARKGFVSKRDAARTDFVRVPDKAAQ